MKIKNQIDLEEVIRYPEKLKDITDVGTRFFITTAMADNYKDKKIKFDKLMEVSGVLDKIGAPELCAYLWRLSSGLNKQFMKEFINAKGQSEELIKKYGKYLG